MPTKPHLDDFHSDHETLIRYLDIRPAASDSRSFAAFWITDNVGRALDQHGVRGQVFNMDPDVFIAGWIERGWTVRVIP